MKIIKNVATILVVLFSITAIITSCTKEEQVNEELNQNSKVTNYLKNFYPTNFKLGKSVETKVNVSSSSLSRSTEYEDYVITEVFVGNDTRARGYIITDKETNDFLYFIDVDRVDLKLTSVKIDVNETILFENINELEKYLSTDEFDYIKIAEDFNSDPSLERRRFWGSELSWGACGPNTDGSPGCFQGQYSTYYVFWIGGTPKPTGITQACDCP